MSDRENHGPEQPPANEQVGYGMPPMRRRFKVSGNPKGRPRGAKNRKTIVKTVANEMHSVTENGKRRRLSTLELVLLRLRNKALEGKSVRALDEYHRLLKVYQPQEARVRGGFLVAPALMETEEWNAEQEKKNVERDARHAARCREKIERQERRKKKLE